MAYKILGQTITTAPSTSPTLISYVKDSSFDAYKIIQRVNNTGNNVESINIASPYRVAVTNTDNKLTSLDADAQTTAPFGRAGSSYGFRWASSGNCYLTQGWAIGQNPDSIPNTSSIDLTSAIPVEPSTTYYMGISVWTSNAAGSVTGRVSWYGYTGSYISNATFSPTDTANTWVRSNTNFTSPSTAGYAIIDLKATQSSGSTFTFFDGWVFGKDSTYATTYTEAYLPSAAAIISPFDKRTNGYLTESYFANTGVTYAGPLQTLYTVPAGKSTVASTLTITNTAGATNYYRVAVIPSGESLAQKHFLFMDNPIGPTTTETITIGMTLAEGDVVKIAADNGAVNATLFGSEN